MTTAALFDLAVNRALSYATRTGTLPRTPEAMHASLELWYLKTRFAYRVPLDEVIAALLAWPGEPQRWQGGRTGGWRPGSPPSAS